MGLILIFIFLLGVRFNRRQCVNRLLAIGRGFDAPNLPDAGQVGHGNLLFAGLGVGVRKQQPESGCEEEKFLHEFVSE